VRQTNLHKKKVTDFYRMDITKDKVKLRTGKNNKMKTSFV